MMTNNGTLLSNSVKSSTPLSSQWLRTESETWIPPMIRQREISSPDISLPIGGGSPKFRVLGGGGGGLPPIFFRTISGHHLHYWVGVPSLHNTDLRGDKQKKKKKKKIGGDYPPTWNLGGGGPPSPPLPPPMSLPVKLYFCAERTGYLTGPKS